MRKKSNLCVEEMLSCMRKECKLVAEGMLPLKPIAEKLSCFASRNMTIFPQIYHNSLYIRMLPYTIAEEMLSYVLRNGDEES